LAEALVYPSLKEGFGWPILEAQACACPVATSDRPPMNRLAGPAAVLADPENESEFAERLFQVLTEEKDAKQDRKRASLRQAANFDPQKFLNQMVTLYANRCH
jgi:glycosyltransferase involved in cell wall biosynthesis